MNQGGDGNSYSVWDLQQHRRHPASPSFARHRQRALPGSGSNQPFYPYTQHYNPPYTSPAFVPASRVDRHSFLDGGVFEQAGYYPTRRNPPNSYRSGYYPDIHALQHSYQHEAMIAHFRRMNTGEPSEPTFQYDQMVQTRSQYGQRAHSTTHYEQAVPLLSGHDRSSNVYQGYPRHARYNEQEAAPSSQFGGMLLASVDPNPHHAQGRSSAQSYYPTEMHADSRSTLRQQSLGLDNNNQSDVPRRRTRSHDAVSEQDRADFDRRQINHFRNLWAARNIDPTKLTPQALADEVFSLQATLRIRRAISTILSKTVEHQIPQEEVPAFRERLRLLWYKYSTIRAQQEEYKGGRRDDWSEDETFYRERDARNAVKAADRWAKNGEQPSKKDTVATEFISSLTLGGDDLDRLGFKALDRRVHRFLRDNPLPSDIQTSEELLTVLVEYLREVRPYFADRIRRRQIQFCRLLDEGRQNI